MTGGAGIGRAEQRKPAAVEEIAADEHIVQDSGCRPAIGRESEVDEGAPVGALYGYARVIPRRGAQVEPSRRSGDGAAIPGQRDHVVVRVVRHRELDAKARRDRRNESVRCTGTARSPGGGVQQHRTDTEPARCAGCDAEVEIDLDRAIRPRRRR